MSRSVSLVTSLLAVLLFGFSAAAGAVSIQSRDGRSLTLPNRFLVDEEGISFLSGNEVVFVEWEKIDLRHLALTQLEIDQARIQAMDTGRRVYFQPVSRPNYYRAFLSQEISVTFNSRFVYRDRVQSRFVISTDGFRSEGELEKRAMLNEGFIVEESTVIRELVERTPYPLQTTVEGLFLLFGNDSTRHSRDVIRELQRHGAFFENLIIGMQNLQEVYPNDPEIGRALRALRGLSTGRTISVEDQRQMRRFVDHARAKFS